MDNGAEILSGPIPQDFKKVIMERAEREGKTVWDALIYMAVNGAEHLRLCVKEDHKRVGAQ